MMTQIRKEFSAAAPRRCCRNLDTAMSAEFFQALGDPTRIAILVRLAGFGRPATVSDIACCYPIDLSVVSRHLAALKSAGILQAEKRGRHVHYSVRYDTITGTLQSMASAMQACCPDDQCCKGDSSDVQER